MLRVITLALATVIGSSLPVVASSPIVTHTQVFGFAAGGSLRVRVSAGRMKIIKGPDPRHIVLRYAAKSADDGEDAYGRVKQRFEVKGSQAEIDLTGPTNGSCNLDVEVELPSPVNLMVRMLAGDLRVEGVEGNMDIADHVGDVTIKPGSERKYDLIDASTRIGGLDGFPGPVHGWLGRSGKTVGGGQYRLHAHVGIGDVHLSFD
jgi:hypothetical protein